MANALAERDGDLPAGAGFPSADQCAKSVAVVAGRDEVRPGVISVIPIKMIHQEIAAKGSAAIARRGPGHRDSAPVAGMWPGSDCVEEHEPVGEGPSLPSDAKWMAQRNRDETPTRTVTFPAMLRVAPHRTEAGLSLSVVAGETLPAAQALPSNSHGETVSLRAR